MARTAVLARDGQQSCDPVASCFLNALQSAPMQQQPFDHWLLNDILPQGFCDAIASLPFAPPEDAAFDGRRETNNALRIFFNPQVQQSFIVCRRLVDGFMAPQVIQAIEEITGTDLADTRLRVEYCQDTDGFWLEPHTDIPVKKFTMLIYLSGDPGLRLAGTDLHEGPPDHAYVGSAPYGKNKGVIFIPGKNTWHGVGHHRFEGVRKSIIVNYVTSEWRDTDELA